MTPRAGPYVIRPIGWVESGLSDRALAPEQGDEGAPDAWLVFDPRVSDGLRDLRAGTEVRVRHLEALDQTPIVDVKPVLGPPAER